MKPDNSAYLAHIRDTIIEIENYAVKHAYKDFINSAWDQAAVARNLEIIGEAASQVSSDFKSKHPQIPWRIISDFRNVLIHEYFAVDPLLVWEILRKDIPVLKEKIEKLIQEK